MTVGYVQQSQSASVALSLTVVAFVVGEVLTTLRLRRQVRSADVAGELVFRGWFFVGILALPAGRSLFPGAVLPGGATTFWIGLVLAWAGLVLRWWSILTLGRSFTRILKVSPDQPVVDVGPYAFVRHPSYSGLLLALLGCGVMVGNWVGALGSFVIVLAAVVYRIRIEERLLLDSIGADYRRYASRHARLVPFLW